MTEVIAMDVRGCLRVEYQIILYRSLTGVPLLRIIVELWRTSLVLVLIRNVVWRSVFVHFVLTMPLCFS